MENLWQLWDLIFYFKERAHEVDNSFLQGSHYSLQISSNGICKVKDKGKVDPVL